MTADLAPLIIVIICLYVVGNLSAWFMMIWPAALVYSVITSALMLYVLEGFEVTNLV